MKRIAAGLAATASLATAAMTLFLAWLAIARARLPYENGRHFDPVDSVVHDQSAVTVLLIWLTARLRRSR